MYIDLSQISVSTLETGIYSSALVAFIAMMSAVATTSIVVIYRHDSMPILKRVTVGVTIALTLTVAILGYIGYECYAELMRRG